jgi:hypothetical protein
MRIHSDYPCTANRSMTSFVRTKPQPTNERESKMELPSVLVIILLDQFIHC